MKTIYQQNQHLHPRSRQGVALVVALFVVAILSTIVIAILADVRGELRMSGIDRNSEKALKLAELGVQVAQATILQGAVSGSLASVDGFAGGGYFFTSVGSGFPGNEKWEQWHYDAGITGNNIMSEVTTPLRTIWMKEAPGRNGLIRPDGKFVLNNVYPIVAGGAFFPIEFETATDLRAVDEYTGKAGVSRFDPPDGNFSWVGDDEGDKTAAEATVANTGYNDGYATRMSPMASFSNMTTPTIGDPYIIQQTIYFTYAGDVSGGTASTSSDRTSTVRLRAINSLCNNTSDTTKMNALWEFDTGVHGIGTAPAVFDPSPGQPGDEIIYFAVVEIPGRDLRDSIEIRNNPYKVTDEPDKLHLYAIVDESSHPDNISGGECAKTGSYRLKWAHPFPDPDVAEWTDYPTEEATATNGQFPPYVRQPADMTPFLPEDDLLFDYRDSFWDSSNDNQPNHVRGNLYTGIFDPPSLSPVVINPLYELDGTNVNGVTMVTSQRKNTLQGVPRDPDDPDSTRVYGDPADPLIELYLVYVAHPTVKKQDSSYGANCSLGYNNYDNYDWGRDYGLKKYSQLQTRVIALRDRLDGDCDDDGEDCTWNWNSPRSRFPTFKWNYRVPSWDPARDDARPWNGYGEFVWDVWFEQQIAPMLGVVAEDQDGARWGDLTDHAGGKRDRYNSVYVTYESLSFPDEAGDTNSKSGPSAGNGSPVDFSGDNNWGDNHMMIMGLRDTWDDYVQGYQTNPMWDAMNNARGSDTPNPYALLVKSSPVEDYWTHKHDGVICENDGAMTEETYGSTSEVVITYSEDEKDEWAGNADKVGFARPYAWWEAIWEANVDGSATRDLDDQGWAGSGLSSSNTSKDVDIEGETSAMCRSCLDGAGLVVSVFNHDLNNIEDLRVHGVNARNGKHIWDYHMPATYIGDYFNATPAIANNRVFVAYVSRNGSRQGAFMQVLDADNGAQMQEIFFDNDPASRSAFDGGLAGRADALLLPPTIANGAVYVGTYHFRGSQSDQSNDSVRIYAYSPVLRMFSLGIYPMAYTNETTIPDFTTPADPEFGMPRAERKLQVWITGAGSKWEELRDTIRPVPTPTPSPSP